jgi:hypothetical protein
MAPPPYFLLIAEAAMERGWFGPKTFGWGVSITSWKGVAATLVFIVLATIVGYTVQGPAMSWIHGGLFVAFIAMARTTYRAKLRS